MKAAYIPCYIQDCNSNSRVEFSVEIPDSINDSYSARFTDQATHGRSTPFKAYSHSGPRSISFTVTIALDYRRDLKAVVDSIRNMMKPKNIGYLQAPKVIVRIGDVINITAAPLNFSVTWREGYIDNMYRVCDCSFSFDEVEERGSFNENSSDSDYQTVTTNTVNVDSSSLQSSTGKYTIGEIYTFDQAMFGYDTYQDAEDGINPKWLPSQGEYPAQVWGVYKDYLRIQYKDNNLYWVRVLE